MGWASKGVTIEIAGVVISGSGGGDEVVVCCGGGVAAAWLLFGGTEGVELELGAKKALLSLPPAALVSALALTLQLSKVI